MQFLSAKPLVEKFRSRTFREEEVAPYFIAYIALTVLSEVMALSSTSNGWDYVSGIGSGFVSVFGLFYLKRRNGNSWGDGYLAKYFSLGWVVVVRMLVIAIPFFIGAMAIGYLAGGSPGADAMGAVSLILFSVIQYRWLGSLIAETVPHRSEAVPPPASALSRYY